MRRCSGLALLLGCLCVLAAAAARAATPAPPADIHVRVEGSVLHWSMAARAQVHVLEAAWRAVPAQALPAPPFAGAWLGQGETRSGSLALAGPAWIELRARLRSAFGDTEIGASTRARPAPAPDRLHIEPAPPQKPTAAMEILATFLYEDRLVDAGGYTGGVQLLPVRHVDAELVRERDGAVLATAATDAEGRLRFAGIAAGSDSASVRLWTRTRRHAAIRVAVLVPIPGAPLAAARPHGVRTAPFALDAPLDLGRLVLRDPDGFAPAQAFHILDVVLDAWDALADPAWLGRVPADSLCLYWGPELRVRGSAYGNGRIEIASPGAGDTDGWSDAVILHEVGHFVADRYLRDSHPGGAHILGDVLQDPRLAYSEGLATAFACWVRAHRAATRRNAAGLPMDAGVAMFVNAGMPPPGAQPGGLQFAWDVEGHRLGDRPLLREGIGSETNLAGVLWDLTDDDTTPDGALGDDDATALAGPLVWSVLGGMRALPAGRGITFEDFWTTWIATTGDAGALAELLRHSGIEFVLDAAEPDLPPRLPPYLWSSHSREAPGDIVLSEIVTAPRPAVEIVNRSEGVRGLGGWQLVARSNHASTNPSLTYTIPDGFGLGPGARVVVWRGGRARDDTARDLHAATWTAPWFPGFEGALALVDASGRGVDFVRWDGQDGEPSRIPPPAGTSWRGRVTAAGPGAALLRRADGADTDAGDDFQAGEPSLGQPNDAPAVRRTFFPEGDVDRLNWRIRADGVYTVQVRRLRDGAAPSLDVRVAGAGRPIARVASGAAQAARLTLFLVEGQELEGRFRQGGDLTRFGVYDVVLVREPDAARALPTAGLDVEVEPRGMRRRLHVSWWNAAAYDSLHVRVGSGTWVTLPGSARAWETDVNAGRYSLELEGVARGVAAPSPELLVAAEDWPETLAEDFARLDTHLWERTGDWDVAPAPGRDGLVMHDSPGGDYANDSESRLRLRGAVLAGPATELRFEHVCSVRPEDQALVEVTDDWGATWQRLARFDWNGAAGWRDGRADAGDWIEARLALGHLAGRPVQVRFTLAADLHGRASGWMLDDLRLGAPAAPPLAARLEAAFPNPFNGSTTLRFHVSRSADVLLRVFDVRGRLVRSLSRGPVPAGAHARAWDGRDDGGRDVAAGAYFVLLRVEGETRGRKVTVVR